jgi:expansin (peptidoglycan-binding protein)
MKPSFFIAALVTGLACLSCGSENTNANGAGPAGGSGGSGGAKAGAGGGQVVELPPVACGAEAQHTGQATFYTTADGSGNCSFDKSPNDLMIGAMNATDYAGAAACGACAHLVGPNGELTIRIVDQCPDCATGNIDLSPEAFDKIAVRSQGRVPITWTYVACDVTGPVTYRFKEGSNQWWTAVQVRHHLYRITKFEVQKSGAFVDVPRQDYNYFVDGNGMGPGPYTFRVTDVYGSSIVDTGVALKVAQEVSGASNFPPCK